MASIGSPIPPFLSTEDWGFQASVIDGDGNPFDVSAYELRAQFRLQGLGTVLDECSTTNGKITRTDDPSVFNVNSLAVDRTWKAAVDTNVVCDLMAYRDFSGNQVTLGVGRLSFKVLAGVTHD